ncbi:AMIN domain-containing protein [Planktothrix mougeotii]|uniref:AMIN domain-containing protein n=1 Tax=Planktothrix mougeotii LEGE 06226 TaxID=1828728 RepID=A0ABR9UCI8_9CYAN|nr:AMIN domain-containing protein [Planktothrix mougeotii]MBE9143279.1 AMIN domain-containing protein [Planktothrix mougeotii LEGE 06226]
MQPQNFKQQFKQTVQTLVASDVPALYGSLLLRTSSLVAAVAITTAYPLAVQAAILGDWKIDPNTGIVEVELPAGNKPQVSAYNIPPRLVLDLPNTEVKVQITENYETGVVRQVSLIQTKPKQAQLVVEFATGITIDPEDLDLRQIGIDNLWVLRPTLQTLPPEEPPTPTNVATTQPQTTSTRTQVAPSTTPPTSTTVKPPEPPKPPQYSVRQYDPRQTALPNPQPMRDSRLEIVQVPVNQPTQVQVLPTMTPPPPPPQTVVYIPQTPGYRPPVPVSETVVVVAPNAQFSRTESLPQAVPFGQPLPPSVPPGTPQSYFNPSPSAILLPTGTTLTLLYPTKDQVRLTRRSERQDVLLLQGGIVDSLGNYIVPPDTPIVGEFETTTKGSRFIAQAINLDGRSIPIQGQSNWIPGSLEVSPERVGIGTGAGSLAGFLVSGFTGIGALVGAIAGAGIGLGTSPSPTTLQPGQMISIQLTQDLTTPNFFLVNQ